MKPVLNFEDATRVGAELNERWQSLTGAGAPALDDMAWADVVQFVLRRARDLVTEREAFAGEPA